jgi:hypothetical protein
LTGLVLAVALCTVGLSAEQKPRKPQVRTRVPSAAKMSINGLPSTLAACVGDVFYNTHALGAAPRGTRVVVDLTADDVLDTIATALVVQMGPDTPDGNPRVQFQYNDDSGTNTDSRLDFTLEYDANVILQVGSYSGEFGCYLAKVEVTPAPQ